MYITHLSTPLPHFVEAFHGKEVVNAGVEADFVHHRDVRVDSPVLSGKSARVRFQRHHFLLPTQKMFIGFGRSCGSAHLLQAQSFSFPCVC